ncbi:MAG: hypothetical protein Q7R41_08185, partial [Phycisphaerales bacterium]|nr:hypothetical protein [Phycisphaerales bacterium]
NFIQSAGILFNQSDLYANPEVLIIRYHPMYPVADIRRGKLWGNYFFESKLRDAIVHELTHASDFQRTAGGNHKQAIDAPAAYYNSPTEVRAYMQGSVDMLKREAHDLKTNRMGRGERDWLRDWMRAAKHGILAHWDLLTPRNQQRFLRALYQAGVEAGLPP